MRLASAYLALVFGTLCWAQTGTRVSAPASNQNQTINNGVAGPKRSPERPAAQATSDSAEDDLPAYKLAFKGRENPAAVAGDFTMIALPVRCTSDGTPFFNTLDPPAIKGQPHSPFTMTVYSVGEKQTHSYSIRSFTDMDKVQFVAMDADNSTVIFLITGVRKSQEDEASSNSRTSLKPASYLAFFDRDGSYNKSVPVGVTYYPRDIAILPTGELMVFGFDELNAAVRVSLLDTDGTLIRNISADDMMVSPAFQDAEKGTGYERAHAVNQTGIGRWRFAHSRGMVLLYEPDSNAPVLEIGPKGARREVPLSPPKGYVLDRFLSASDRWIASFQEDGPNKPGLSFAGNSSNRTVLYELNPSDGTLRYRIDLGAEIYSNPNAIACEHDGSFLAFKSDIDGKLVLLDATVGR